MRPNKKPYLIVAQSGRSLAVSAALADIHSIVIDRFADMDTQSCALSTQIVRGDDSGLNSIHLLEILDNYIDMSVAGVVVGSGLEARPEILDIIDRKFPLMGNKAPCVKSCKDPGQFFSLLDSLNISHPDISLTGGFSGERCLVKQIGGTGGQHINHYVNKMEPSVAHYYQRFIRGRSLSILFLADGHQASILGVNETWARDPENNDFRYAGAVTLNKIEPMIFTDLRDIVQVLVKNMQLFGLCSLDVIVDDDRGCHVLEINPRPTATIELHERGFGLFYAHIMACQGNLIAMPKDSTMVQGHAVLFADTNFTVPQFDWPAWVVDRSPPGTKIASGEPICTIRAAAKIPVVVRELLQRRGELLKDRMGLHSVAA